MPKLLNLACGNRLPEPLDGWEVVNHDRWKHRPEITVTHDLNQYPWPFEDNEFQSIIAFDIIEHIPGTMKFIEELWRIAAPGGEVFIHTCWASPHVESRGGWRDPTHLRLFHEDSFHYFDPYNGGGWYENYGKFYTHARFRISQIDKEPPDNIGFHLVALKDSDGVHGVGNDSGGSPV